MARVLVTGATGLIGRHICAGMAKVGYDVHGAARNPTELADVVMHACNILDTMTSRALVQDIRPDIIIHSAWVTQHGAYWQSPQNHDWLRASLSLMTSACLAGAGRFVGVGTCAEYATADIAPRNERTSSIAPEAPYGKAKDEFRRAAEVYAAAEGLSFAWARVFMLYGAREHPDRFVASLARALVAGQPARMSSGKVVRDFLDARDVGLAVASLATSGVVGPVNVGSGDGISLHDAGQKLAEIAGRPDLFAPGALPDRPNEPASLVADVTRLKREVGFRPSVELEQGFRDALDYWRSQ